MHDDDLTEADDLSDADLAADEIDTTRNIVPRLPSLVEDPNLVGQCQMVLEISVNFTRTDVQAVLLGA